MGAGWASELRIGDIEMDDRRESGATTRKTLLANQLLIRHYRVLYSPPFG
jgi:hypothetical protein